MDENKTESILLSALDRVLAQRALWPLRRALEEVWAPIVDRCSDTVFRKE